MRRLIHILAASIAVMTLYSCGTAGYLASGYDVDELRDVVLFEPVAKIETIGKGDITVTNDTACRASQELLLQTLKTYDTGLNISEIYSPESLGEYDGIRKDIEYVYAQLINAGNAHESFNFIVPEGLDRLVEQTGNRYGMIAYQYGFSRTGSSYAAEIAKGVGLALLTLGTVYTIPYKDKSNIHFFIIDSEQNRIAWQNFDIGADYNPLKPKHIEKQFKRIFKQFTRKRK